MTAMENDPIVASAPINPPEGSTLYYALLQVPEHKRQNLLAVLNLCEVLATTLNDVEEPSVAEKKIHWWHEEITRLHAGEARHPATQAVSAVLCDHTIEPSDWLNILIANNDEKFVNAKDEADYQARLQQDYNTRIQLCSQLLQGHNNTPEVHWAAGFGQFDRLRRFHRLHSLGYPVFPDTDYALHKLQPSDIGLPEQRIQVSALFAQRTEMAIAALQQALLSQDPAMGPGSLPFYTLASLRKAQLSLWQRKSVLPSEGYSTLTPVKKAWLAWRCRSLHRGKAL